MRLLSAILIGLVTLFSFGCGSDSYKDREADPNFNDEVLVGDPAMGAGEATSPAAK